MTKRLAGSDLAADIDENDIVTIAGRDGPVAQMHVSTYVELKEQLR